MTAQHQPLRSALDLNTRGCRCSQLPCFHDLIALDKQEIVERLAAAGGDPSWGSHKARLVGDLLRLTHGDAPAQLRARVAGLEAELRALTAENERLRALLPEEDRP